MGIVVVVGWGGDVVVGKGCGGCGCGALETCSLHRSPTSVDLSGLRFGNGHIALSVKGFRRSEGGESFVTVSETLEYGVKWYSPS